MIRLAIAVQREQAELVLAELLELAPGGVEEVDRGGGVVEYAVYGPPGELPALPDLTAAAGGALVQITSSEIGDDWAERWREFHRPLVLPPRLTVRPPWAPAGDTPIDLVIDPGQAFGTGAHATTRLCLELMLEMEGADGFLDLGCGSGVLAIAAARLGWGPVLAVDFDPFSVQAARDNAAVNGVEITVARHDLRVDPVRTAPTVAANLLAPLLLGWSERLAGSLSAGAASPAGGRAAGPARPRRLIAGGLLEHEADRVAEAFAASGLDEIDRRVLGDWAALRLER